MNKISKIFLFSLLLLSQTKQIKAEAIADSLPRVAFTFLGTTLSVYSILEIKNIIKKCTEEYPNFPPQTFGQTFANSIRFATSTALCLVGLVGGLAIINAAHQNNKDLFN